MYEYVRSGTTGSLYTHHMQRQIAAFECSGVGKKSPSVRNGEMARGEEPTKQGAVVRCHRRVVAITGATNVSSQAWGGLIRWSFGAFSADDFSTKWYNAHINVKETFALYEVLKLVTTTHPGSLKGSTSAVDVDNKAMHGAFKKECSRNAHTHDHITKLFWLFK